MTRVHRGEASEALVEQAIRTISRKKSDDLPPIRSYIHADPNSHLDRRGIDFLVRLENGLDIPIQVKSSTRGKRKFEKSHRFGVFIPVVVVAAEEHISRVINRVIQCIRLIINLAKRQKDRVIYAARCKSMRRAKTTDRCVRHFAASMCH